MRTCDGGVAAVAYAPCRAQIEVDGAPVTLSLETDYPFRDSLRFTVTAGRPVRFPLLLRIPGWAKGCRLQVADEEASAPAPATFCRIEREWCGATEVNLVLPMAPALVKGYRGAIAIERGPLIYSLRIGEEWRRVHADLPYRELPHADWEVHPTTPWNYALAISDATLAQSIRFHEHPVREYPFSPDGAPITATVLGRRAPAWTMENGSAADAPLSPIRSSEPLEELTLLPYGCTNLRITEFPVS
jgi:hypothetical protein